MLELDRYLQAFEKLGKYLNQDPKDEELQSRITEAYLYNNWFTPENIEGAITNIANNFLDRSKLEQWVASYQLPVKNPYKVGIVMAGNIPLVGFHDLLAVLISGHYPMVKLSSKDRKLLPHLLNVLHEIDAEIANRITIVDMLKDFDAIIATGSNNTSRYFDYYFGKYPNIIRKNRNSLAVLTGNESEQQLQNLGKDVFQYFGLGCRNVSKLLVPKEFDFDKLFSAFEPFRALYDHNKYANNYDYHKGLLLLNEDTFKDTGFLLLREKESLASPMATLHYEYYHEEQTIQSVIGKHNGDLQLVVGNSAELSMPELDFGATQAPELWHYPDKLDTLAFLEDLN